MFFSSRRISKRNKKIKDLVASTGQHAFHLALQYTNDRDIAKDIVQASLTKTLEAKDLPLEGLEYWFLRIVRNTATDFIRSKKIKTSLSEQIRQHEVSTKELKSSLEILEQNDYVQKSKSTIEKALEQLSSEQREIIVLKDLHDYNYAQIAKILDLANGTVMSRLHRARLALKNEVLKL